MEKLSTGIGLRFSLSLLFDLSVLNVYLSEDRNKKKQLSACKTGFENRRRRRNFSVHDQDVPPHRLPFLSSYTLYFMHRCNLPRFFKQSP